MTSRLTFRDKVNSIESSAIRDLLQKFKQNQHALMEEFKSRDKIGSKVLQIHDWSQAIDSVLNLGLPWRILRSRLADLNENGLVLYETTFGKYDDIAQKNSKVIDFSINKFIKNLINRFCFFF
jgi:serine/threonine-protein phosphatase with EF-hand domain